QTLMASHPCNLLYSSTSDCVSYQQQYYHRHRDLHTLAFQHRLYIELLPFLHSFRSPSLSDLILSGISQLDINSLSSSVIGTSLRIASSPYKYFTHLL